MLITTTITNRGRPAVASSSTLSRGQSFGDAASRDESWTTHWRNKTTQSHYKTEQVEEKAKSIWQQGLSLFFNFTPLVVAMLPRLHNRVRVQLIFSPTGPNPSLPLSPHAHRSEQKPLKEFVEGVFLSTQLKDDYAFSFMFPSSYLF